MSNEPKHRTDIDIGEPEKSPTDINRHVGVNRDSKATSNSVIINRRSRFKEKALTIADIQDNEDRNDRISTRQPKSKVEFNYKGQKKGKRKRKLIEYDYGEEDEELYNRNQPISLSDTKLKVQYIDQNSGTKRMNRTGSSPFVSYGYNESLESKKNICSLLLENFDNLKILEFFSQEADYLLQLHLFHLYIYSIIHDQGTFFLEGNNGLFNSGKFMKILSNLLHVNELNYNFNSKFIPSDNLAIERKSMKERTTEKIEVPSIILKRLDISHESQ